MKIIYTDNICNNINLNIRYIVKATLKTNFGGIGSLEKIQIVNPAKTKNRFAHVLWTTPMLKDFKETRWNIGNQYEQSLALSALSLACLKAHNQEVVLYTDTMGKQLCEHLGYDRIYTIFDNLNVPNDFWAAGKIMALQNEPLDSIIIDNDLFLYDGSLIDKLAEEKVFCSHLEKTTKYKPMLELGQNYFKHLQGANEYSSNTGILKCPDVRLKTMFIQAYFNMIKSLNNPKTLNYFKEIGQGAFCPDLLAEQFNYHKICKPNRLVALPEKQNEFKGFTHLIAFEKYLKMPIVLDVLKNQFSDYYTKVISKWQELDFSIEIE